MQEWKTEKNVEIVHGTYRAAVSGYVPARTRKPMDWKLNTQIPVKNFMILNIRHLVEEGAAWLTAQFMKRSHISRLMI